MIEKLTPSQEARMPEYAAKWIKIGTSTEPTDRVAAEAAIHKVYECGGLKPPERIIWSKSPTTMVQTIEDTSVGASVGASVRDSVRASVGASVRGSVWASVGDSVWGSVWASVGDSVWASVGASVGDSVWASVRGSIRASVGASVRGSVRGQHEAGWLSHYDYFAEVVGLEEETSKLAGIIELAKTCGWIIPYKNVCYASDKMTVCELDDNNVIHCETGPAIAYADDLEIYAWHGTVVPKRWIEGSPDVKEVLKTDNMEVRAAGMHIIGWANLLTFLDAKLIDSDEDPLIGELYSVQLPGLDGRHLIVKYTCPRNGVMGQPVPPENHLNGEKITTILGAKAWIAEMTLEGYMPPEIRT